MELMPLQKLDNVLWYFAKHSEPLNIFFPEIVSKVMPNEVSLNENEALMILDKLIKDGYVKKHTYNENSFDERISNGYSLTYEGLVFIKYQNGYLGRFENAQIENRIKKRNEILLILGTWLAGIGATALVIWEIFDRIYFGKCE